MRQVRHPRSVLRSVNGPPAWDFTYHGIRGWEWVPGPYGALWPQLSRAAKGLLWWSSFCLLAEAQLGAESAAWRMEDVFYGHDARPVHALLSLATGAPGRPERVAAALKRAAPYNVHAKTSAKLEAWDDLVRAARGQANATLRAAEVEAVTVARALAMRYGYTTRR